MTKTFPFLCAGMLLLAGCLSPALRLDHQAQRLGLEIRAVAGTRFRHRLYTKGTPCSGARVHVYLEGDGRAWLTPGRVAPDPTPPHSCLLELMARDPAPTVYLGRPCYHGFALEEGCAPRLWTLERYGDPVLASMTAALGRILAGRSCRAVLIGFSGGAALAMGMASRTPERIAGVITLMGNLDLEEWTRLHHYTPLHSSLNPAALPPLADSVFQIHIAGGKDHNIPAILIRREADRQPGSRYLLLPEHSHECPGNEIWNAILTGVEILENSLWSGKNGAPGTSP